MTGPSAIAENAVRYFLIVERPENWDSDQRSGFLHFGLPERRRALGQSLRAGDILLTYVSRGVSAFSDIREITRDGVERARRIGTYDEPYPWLIRTKPVVVLPRIDWVPVRRVLPCLELAARHQDWRSLFRLSMRELSMRDGLTIRRVIEEVEG